MLYSHLVITATFFGLGKRPCIFLYENPVNAANNHILKSRPV